VTSHPVKTRKAADALKGEKITKKLIDEVAELVSKECAPISPIWRAPIERRQTIKSLVKKGLEGAVVSGGR
jgi:CO/xanthine dehydrogenase FAD-binding subunit